MSDPALSIPPVIRRLARAVQDAGGQAVAVGGSVRDPLLGLPTKDWDVEIHRLEADELEQLLRRFGRVSTIGRSFGVFKLHHPQLALDVSLPRSDSKVGPGHRGIQATGDPWLGLHEAARRRDLTVNAIMVDLHTGAVIDPHDGLSDLRARRLRAVDEDTFLEDPLRALRAVQFAARLDFSPEPSLIALCARARLDELPHERILGEWAKLMLRGVRVSRGMALARAAHILPRVFPEVVDAPTLDAALDRAVALRDLVEHRGRRLALMMAVWLRTQPPEAVLATLDRLHLHRFEGFPTRDTLQRVHVHPDHPHRSDPDLRHLAAACDPTVWVLARAAVEDTEPQALLAPLDRLGVRDGPPAPLLMGRHLKALGPPGPWMGDLLKAVYRAQLDGEVATLDEAKALASALRERD